MGYERSRSLVVTADAVTNQTLPCACKQGGVATISAPGAFSATITLQRRGADLVWRDVTNNSGVVSTFTAAGTYTFSPNMVEADYRLNMKSGAYVSGQPITMMIEGS